jgi:hypothetical protein
MHYNAPIFIKMHCDTQVVFIWFFSAGFIFQFSRLYISGQRPFTGGKGPGGLWKSYRHTAVCTQREHQTRIRKYGLELSLPKPHLRYCPAKTKVGRKWYQSTGITLVIGGWTFFFNFIGPESWILQKMVCCHLNPDY